MEAGDLTNWSAIKPESPKSVKPERKQGGKQGSWNAREEAHFGS
jgi:hypothetical protein